MMNINKDMLSAYVNRFAGVGHFGLGVDRMLENWDKAKSVRLQRLFGEKLILEKDVKFEKDVDQLASDIDDRYIPFKSDFYCAISDITWIDYDLKWSIRNLVSPVALAGGRVLEGFAVEHPETKKKLRVDVGQKVMGAIKQVIKFFNLELSGESFEEFRIEISQILNDKLVRGTMCLSIHPFDYMTLSDNNHGWESCMSWMQEGCYRAGTLEVMNCDNTVVAYLKSAEDDFSFTDFSLPTSVEYEWSSKKWRQLFHVTDKIVMSNKPYPYFHNAMTKFCLDWLKELATERLDMKFNETMFDYDNMDKTQVEGISLWANTQYMYNDLENGSESKFYVVEGEENGRCVFDIGGHAYCLECGHSMDRENGLNCYDCSDEFYCDCCDDNCSGEAYETVDGSRVCEYCYDNYYYSCEECGDVYHHRSIEYYDDEICEGRYCDCCRQNFEQEEEDKKGAEQLLAIEPVE